MIISPKYKFVFLAQPRTGSTTIHKMFLEYVVDENLINNSTINLGHKHLGCKRFLENYKNMKDYFKFAFTRNPWDRVVSWYHFPKRASTTDINTSDAGFDAYIKNYENIWATSWQDQYEFTKCCDFIGRFENLQEDFNIICDKIGIDRIELPHKNKSKHKHYTEYYNDETREIVAERFLKDTEHFGYEYGE